MINPAVISLASLQKFTNLDFPYRFEIEDNIGEAIHVHYKDIRLDLTVKEFEELALVCEKVLDDLVGVSGFSCKDFDPMLLTMISADLPRIRSIEKREVFLEDILVDTVDDDGNKIYAPIYKSRVFKAMQGADYENEAHFQTNYLSPLATGEISNKERIAYNLAQIKKYGYPHGNELIGIDHHNRIWDGQHRACCLYYLYGNIKVPVRTIYFNDEQDSENFRIGTEKWLETEKELFALAEKTEQESSFLYKTRKFVKLLIKKLLWCTWTRADDIENAQFNILRQIEDRLGEIEKNLSER